jgi:MFS family permease
VKVVFWGGQLLSLTGSTMQATVLPLWLYALTGSAPLALGGFGAEALARALVSPFAGALLDRLPRDRMLVAADLAGLLGVAVLLAGVHDRGDVWLVYPVAFVTVVATQTVRIGVQAVLPDLVGPAGLARANSVIQTSGAAVSIVAPPAGIALVHLAGYRGALLVNLVSYAVAATATVAAVWGRSLGRAAQPRPLRGPAALLGDGWRQLSASPAARRAVLVEAALFAVFGCSDALLYGVVLSGGHGSPAGSLAGFAMAGLAGGALLGGLLLPVVARHVFATVAALVCLGPVLVVAGARSGNAPVVAGGAVLVGAASVVLLGGVATLCQRVYPTDVLGAVMGLRRGVAGLAEAASFAWLVALATAIGFPVVYAAAGLLAALLAGYGAYRRTPAVVDEGGSRVPA